MAPRAAESNEDAAIGAMSEAIGVYGLHRTASSTEWFDLAVQHERLVKLPFGHPGLLKHFQRSFVTHSRGLCDRHVFQPAEYFDAERIFVADLL